METPQREIVELYKIHLELTNKISDRRGFANQFYLSLITSLLVFVAFYLKEFSSSSIVNNELFLILMSCVGLFLCIVWWYSLSLYRKINETKFDVLLSMESALVFDFLNREWKALNDSGVVAPAARKKPQSSKRYLPISQVEQFAPLVLAIPYVLLLAYSTLRLLKVL